MFKMSRRPQDIVPETKRGVCASLGLFACKNALFSHTFKDERSQQINKRAINVLADQ